MLGLGISFSWQVGFDKTPAGWAKCMAPLATAGSPLEGKPCEKESALNLTVRWGSSGKSYNCVVPKSFSLPG